MADEQLVFSGDSSKAVAALRAIRTEQDQLKQAIKLANKEAKKGSDEALLDSVKYKQRLKELYSGHKDLERQITGNTQKQREFFSSGIGQVKNLAGALLGIGSAAGAAMTIASALRAELEKFRALDRKAVDANLEFGKAFAAVQPNFIADKSIKNATELEAAIRKISERTGVGANVVAQLTGEALSTKGARSNAQALSTIDAALQIFPSTPETAQVFAGRAQQLAGAAGRSDVREALGFAQQVGAQAQISDPKKILANMLPAAMAASSPEVGGEVYATMTGGLGAEPAKTASLALITSLQRFGKNIPDTFNGEIISDEARAAYSGANNEIGMIRALQAHPLLKEAFFGPGNNNIEPQAIPFAKQLLTPGSEADRAFRLNVANIRPIDQNQVPFFQELSQRVQSVEGRTGVTFDRSFQSALKTALSTDTTRLRRGLARDALTKTFENIDESWGNQSYDTMKFEQYVANGMAPERAAMFGLRRQLGGSKAARAQFDEVFNTGIMPTDLVNVPALRNQQDYPTLLRAAAELGRQQRRMEAGPLKPIALPGGGAPLAQVVPQSGLGELSPREQSLQTIMQEEKQVEELKLQRLQLDKELLEADDGRKRDSKQESELKEAIKENTKKMDKLLNAIELQKARNPTGQRE